MNAYIKTAYEPGIGFVGQVVSEQDYHERGPHSRTHQTAGFEHEQSAFLSAQQWMEKNRYMLVSAEEI